MGEFFSVPARWALTDYVWQQSFDDMALDGAMGREGVALWLGHIDGETAVATLTVLLRGPGVIKRHNQLAISAGLMNMVTLAALKIELILVGQIHSHSPLASTDLSYPDRHMGITDTGYLSLVAPNFAQGPTELTDCGVHVHEGAEGWRRLPHHEILQRFTQPSVPAQPPLIIGGDA
jgi:proteasome lid subunit RPN8/RPN11